MAPTDSRSSTMRHLRKLMAATAVAGLAAATSRGASARNAAATPDAGTDAGTDGAKASTDVDAGTDAEPDAAVPVPDIGYGVVDPLPPPARGCGCHNSPGMAEE
jgi:hypothetical protein